MLKKIYKKGLLGTLKTLWNVITVYKNRYLNSIRILLVKIKQDNIYVIREIQDSKMFLNLNDVGISRELLFTGIHEAESTIQIKKEIQPGMTIAEIGANIGYYALLEASIIGKEGKIIAFEPSPVNMLMLKSNVLLNGYNDRFETYELGIGKQSGQFDFHLMNKGNMSSFLHRNEGDGIKSVTTIKVNVVSLDNFLKDRPQKIDYLRMDVEGFEYEVISGMIHLLHSKYAPQGMFIEVHSDLLNKFGYSCEKFLNFLGEHGYEVKIARYRGRPDTIVYSSQELIKHSLCEIGYWEAFFKKINA